MAGIYVSYRSSEKRIVDALVPLLERHGDRVVSPWGHHVGASWRDELMTGLPTSDALLVIWGETTHASQYVPAEVGAARASGTVAVLPVLIGETPVPLLLRDLFFERLDEVTPELL